MGFCELDRRPAPNPSEKIFIIRGSHDQVELAKRMISEKLGLDTVMNSQGPMGAPPTQYPLDKVKILPLMLLKAGVLLPPTNSNGLDNRMILLKQIPMLLRGLLTINSSNTSNSLVVVLHLHNNREHLDNPKEIAEASLSIHKPDNPITQPSGFNIIEALAP